MKRLLSVFAIAALAILSVACVKEVKLTGISLDQKTLALKVGEDATLKVIYTPDDAVDKAAATWETSAPAVATVVAGKVTAVGAGTATITAKVGTFTATCDVTVTKDDPIIDPVEPDVTIYGNLEKWATVPAVDGTGAINKLRVALDEERIYFLLEVVKNALSADAAADYANYCTIFYSNGAGSVETAWKQNYDGDKSQLWLMSKGNPKVSNWDDGKLKEAVVIDDIVYFVYSIPRANKEILGGGNLYVAASINDQTVTNCNDGEVWSANPVEVGFAPAAEGDMFHVIIGEEPVVEPEDNWDYTPGAAYLASGNLWKPVDDANGTNFYYYNCTSEEWNGQDVVAAEVPFLKKTSSTYRLFYPEATKAGEIWMKQFFIFPFGESNFVALNPEKTYDLAITLGANKPCPAFFKLETYSPDHPKREGATIWEKGTFELSAEPVVIEKKGITGIECNNINLIFAFGGNSEGTFVYIKDITLVESEPVEPIVDTYDYTPGAAYLASNNLWKPVDDANALKYFYYSCSGADWNGTETETTEVPFLTRSQSTFKLEYANATTQQWQNQFFMYPFDASHFLALDPAKKYKFSVTVQAPSEANGFFKLSKFNPENTPKYEGECIWEHGAIAFEPNKPIVLETEIAGVECSNIVLVFDFGANGANTVIYIKDITLVEEVSPKTISEICAETKGAAVIAKTSVVIATSTMGFVATDGAKAIYVYTNKTDFNGLAKVGDVVTFAGSKTVFNGVHEVEKVTDVQVLASGYHFELPAAKDITADVLTYDNTEAELVSLVGTLAKSGNYYNVTVEGVDPATKQGSISYPTADLGVDALDGKKIKVTGIFNGLSSKGKFVNIIATSVEEVKDTPAAAITLDGDMSDWANIEAIENPGGTITEWKYTSDADNLYFQFKIERSDIKAAKTDDPEGSGVFPFKYRRYIYIGIDTDNNPETGDAPTSGDMTITGCEVLALVYPFRGNATSASGTDGATVVNGEDSSSWIKLPANGSKTGEHLSIFGTIDDDFGYLEMALPKAKIGSPAPGTYKIQFSLASNLTAKADGGNTIVIN